MRPSGPFLQKASNEEIAVLHYIGEAYSQRPSQLLGISDPLAALNLDAFVLLIGRQHEQETAGETSTQRPAAKPAVSRSQGQPARVASSGKNGDSYESPESLLLAGAKLKRFTSKEDLEAYTGFKL